VRTLRLALEVLVVASRFGDKRRIGRRREKTESPRTERHVVKVNIEEQAALLRLAAHQNVSVPRLLVESTLRPDTSVSRADLEELKAALFGLSRQISAVGVNLNQIAKVANATGEVPNDLQAALGGLRKLYFRVENALDEVASVRGDFI